MILPDGAVEPRDPTKGKHKITAREVKKLHGMQADSVVIGTGESGNAKLTAKASAYLESSDFSPIILPSALAADKFNQETSDGKRVAALMHITC